MLTDKVKKAIDKDTMYLVSGRQLLKAFRDLSEKSKLDCAQYAVPEKAIGFAVKGFNENVPGVVHQHHAIILFGEDFNG